MKTTFSILVALLMFSCSQDKQCQYKTMVTTSYNFNKGVSKRISLRDTMAGCYSVTKTNTETTLSDVKRDFKIKITVNPNILDITEGIKNSVWIETRGLKISNDVIGDTLFIRCMPTQDTPDVVLKFGTEYKFYN